MRILTGYILKQIVIGFLILTTSLVLVVWLTQSLRFIDSIIGKGLPFSLFLKVTLSLIPFFFIVISPLSLFVSVLFIYNRMNNDREVIVLKSSGLGYFQMIKPALVAGLALTALALYFTLEVIPSSYQSFRELQWKIKNDLSHIMIRPGEFNPISDRVTLYVKEKTQETQLSGIMLNDISKPEKKVTLLARRGQLITSGTSPKVIMEDGSRQEVSNTDGHFSILYFDSYVMDFSFFSKEPVSRRTNLSELSVAELVRSIPGASDNEKARIRGEIHERFSMPLYNLTFALVAAFGVVFGTFNRRGSGMRLFFLVCLMLALQSLSLIVKNLSIRFPYLFPLMYAVPLFPVLLILFCARHPEGTGAFFRLLFPPSPPNPGGGKQP